MSKGTTQVRIKCPGTLPLFVNFKDFNIPQLEMGTTYLLRLEVPLEGEKNHVTQQKYEISETTIPSWLSDSFKENSYVGISFPNKNCYDAKNQALMVAALQYSIKNGGARLKSHILTEIQKNEENSGTRQVSTILHMKSFAINILNESYNKNGEFFVECEFLKDEMSKNEITAQVSIFNKDSIFNDSYDINCILASNIAGTLCKTTYVCHIEKQPLVDDSKLDTIIEKCINRLTNGLPKEITERLYIRVRSNLESFPVAPSGKRDYQALINEGINEKARILCM